MYRDLELSSRSAFGDLHQAIVQHFGLKDGQEAEVADADQSWYAGDTVANLTGSLINKGPRLSEHVNDPHQRFVLGTTSYNPVNFLIELKKVLKDDPAVVLPRCTASEGDPPIYTQPPPQPVEDTGEEDILPLTALTGAGNDAEPDLLPSDDDIIDFGGIEDGDVSEVADDSADEGEDDDDMMEEEEGDMDGGDDMRNFGSFDPDDL